MVQPLRLLRLKKCSIGGQVIAPKAKAGRPLSAQVAVVREIAIIC
jgi:hypothetical protein